MGREERRAINKRSPGKVVAGRPITDESEHFYRCKACGQMLDMRNLGDVFHHEDKCHKPIPPDA